MSRKRVPYLSYFKVQSDTIQLKPKNKSMQFNLHTFQCSGFKMSTAHIGNIQEKPKHFICSSAISTTTNAYLFGLTFYLFLCNSYKANAYLFGSQFYLFLCNILQHKCLFGSPLKGLNVDVQRINIMFVL